VVVDTKTAEVFEPDTSTNSGPARGEFDPQGNYWAGGRGGMLVKFDTSKKRIFEYRLPTPYASLYSAQVDKNGEVWAGEMHAGRYARFNPKTEQWTEYVLPEPYGIAFCSPGTRLWAGGTGACGACSAQRAVLGVRGAHHVRPLQSHETCNARLIRLR
jgi:streptogramin lyase